MTRIIPGWFPQRPLPGRYPAIASHSTGNFSKVSSEDEVTAAIAHESAMSGFSLIIPYLQTEALANDIALRVVDRETMKKVYSKLWAHTGTAGNIEELLGRSIPKNLQRPPSFCHKSEIPISDVPFR
jgi:hypothetical protein